MLPFEAIPGPKPSIPFIGTKWIYLPLIGYYKSIKMHEANMDKYLRYGPIMKEEYQWRCPSVTVFDPVDIREVFMREAACPARPVMPYVVQHRLSSPSRYPNVGLANMMGSEWLELRTRLAPLLLSKELKESLIGSQNRVSTRLVNYIKSMLPPRSDYYNKYDYYKPQQCPHLRSQQIEQQSQARSPIEGTPNLHSISTQGGGLVRNIQEVFYRFSMESIMNSCINQQLGCLDNENDNNNINTGTSCDKSDNLGSGNGGSRYYDHKTVMSDGEHIFRAAMNFFKAQHQLHYGSNLFNRPYRQLCDSHDTIHDIASKYIDIAISDLKRRPQSFRLGPGGNGAGGLAASFRHDDSLLETLHNTGKFSDSELKSTIVDFINGGIYTVANTLTMTLFLLASNPEVQDQLYEEICTVCNDGNGDINIDTDKLDRMKFLKLCLKESYRLLPTIPGIARTIQHDLVLSNYLVPKNTLVFCNLMVTCRLPQYFENPDSYIPSRWEQMGKSKGELAFTVLPFGHGVRKCIGHNFAELKIYVALAKIIKNFKVRTVNRQDISSLKLAYKFIVVPEDPVTLEFIPRD